MPKLALALTLPLLTACASFPPASSEVVTASAVIDTLKTQLAAAGVTAHPTIGPGGLCGTADKKVVVIATPVRATVSLKTVATTATSGSVGATIPVLSQSLGPSFAYTETRAVTQVLTFDLNIVHTSKTEADLTDEVKTLHTRIDADNAELKDLAGPKKISEDQIEFLKTQIASDTAMILQDEAALVRLHTAPGYGEVSTLDTDIGASADASAAPQSLVPHTETVKTDLSIAAAITAAIQELLNVNHNLRPCLKPQTVKVEVDFDVQKKKDGSIVLTVVIWKFGTERVATSENFHSIVVTFDMTQGSSTLVQ